MQLARLAKRWRISFWPLWLVVCALAWKSIALVLQRCKGVPSVPLDDAYIHFQFARAWSNFTPFTYTHGSAPVGGATSLAWPALLAPAFWLGVDDVGIIWWSWLLGFLCLGLLAHETYAIGRGLLSPIAAAGASLMALCFGGLTWLAASGMEAVPFAWLWLRTFRRLADWVEAFPGPAHVPLRRELLVLCVATPLMRPEGTVACLCVAVTLGFVSRGRDRVWGLCAATGALLPKLFLWLGTGSATTTTTLVKWLPNNPYLSAGDVAAQVFANLRLLYGTLFNGELWSSTVIPSGGAVVAICALPALAFLSYRQRRFARGGAILVAALGIWIPTTYDTFLWNRLRYLWPFTPAWFVAMAGLSDLVGDFLARFEPRLRDFRGLLAGGIAGAFAAKLPLAIDDLAESSHAIKAQQTSLGRWARQHLPPSATIGVNDTGAIAYFSRRKTFDVVGLTTPGEARYWVAGPGSRFEHYERLPRASLPTHFIVYPEWFAIPPLLGEYLTDRYVNASILGGTTMVASEADYSSLDSAEHPVTIDVSAKTLVDRLDVADLDSEKEHGYELLGARQAEDRVYVEGDWVDGGRAERTLDKFRLRLTPGGSLVVRFCGTTSGKVALRLDGALAGTVQFGPGWGERALALPDSIPAGVENVEIAIDGSPTGVLHYWSYADARTARDLPE